MNATPVVLLFTMLNLIALYINTFLKLKKKRNYGDGPYILSMRLSHYKEIP